MRKPLSENIVLQQLSVLLSVFFRNPKKFHSLIGGQIHIFHDFSDGVRHSAAALFQTLFHTLFQSTGQAILPSFFPQGFLPQFFIVFG